MRFIAESRNARNPENPYWDNTNQLAKILYRWRSHGVLFGKALQKNASLKRLLITRFPFIFRDSFYPPSMHIEFTDACNLKCVYCNNPFFPYPRKMMDKETFSKLIGQIKNSKIDRICIGGGEATIHPDFNEFVRELSKVSKILTIVTNGHWKDKEVQSTLLQHVDFIEISVEAGDGEEYERTRIGGDYQLLLQNLMELNRRKKELKSSSNINLRLMVRPSQKGKIEKESIRYWRQFGNTIMPQYVLKTVGVDTISDVFHPKLIDPVIYSRCTLPFRNIQVRCNGDVPICQVSGSALDDGMKVIAGNIHLQTIDEIWHGSVFKRYRTGIRYGKPELLKTCDGCKGC